MKIGFIGCGNMALAMINGIINNQLVENEDIYYTDKTGSNKDKKDALGINKALTNISLVETCDIIILAIKPHLYEMIAHEIKDVVTSDKILVSIAPGKTLEWLQSLFNKDTKIVRTMPNTPAMVNEGMSALCYSDINVTNEDIDKVQSIFNSFGQSAIIEERLMDAFVGVAGSSPAYFFMMIEAMGDAGGQAGLPRDLAYQFAAQTMLGSAQMYLDTKLHPGILKDQVCSPGGSTIVAVNKLEETGLRTSLIQAITACIDKAKSM